MQSHNPFGQPAASTVDRLLGKSYHVVKEVYLKLKEITSLYEIRDSIVYLSENKEELESIKDAAASLNTIFENIDEIRTVEANIALIEQVISNLEVIENAVANLDTLETADEVAKEVRNAISVVEGLKTEAQTSANKAANSVKESQEVLTTLRSESNVIKEDLITVSNKKKEELNAISGTYYYPSVSSDGTLYWSNTGNQKNPAPINIRGPQGEGLKIKDSLDSENQLPNKGLSGDAYFVGEDLFIWSPSKNSWVNKGQLGGGGLVGLMTPDPREYFLYILGDSGSEDPEEPEEDPSYSPVLNTGKLNYLVLA